MSSRAGGPVEALPHLAPFEAELAPAHVAIVDGGEVDVLGRELKLLAPEAACEDVARVQVQRHLAASAGGILGSGLEIRCTFPG